MDDVKEREIIENITKIKYINVLDKIYKVTDISVIDMSIRVVETDNSITDVPENEIFDFNDLKDFRLRLINNGGKAEIVNFAEWKREHK